MTEFRATHVVTEIDCHNCNGTFSVRFAADKNGNHVVECPKCGHEHCRIIEDGRVTSAHWDSKNGPTYNYSAIMGSYTSMSSTAIGGGYYTSGTTSTDSYLSGWTERRSI